MDKPLLKIYDIIEKGDIMAKCEYANVKSKFILCEIQNKECVLVRWCVNEQCLKNSDNYKKCRIRSDDVGKKKNKIQEKDIIVEKEQKENDVENNVDINIDEKKYKEIKCKVIRVKKDKISISFKGYGVTLKIDNNPLNIEDGHIKVKYLSDIGKSDFQIKIT